ncbi:MAG: restriction endonuclease subunit S [Actinomycetota bacterium]
MSVVTSLLDRTGWEVTPFGRLTRRSKEAGRPDFAPLSVFLDAGVVPRSDREDNHNRLGADLSNYLVVRPDDIVFNKLRTWQGGLGVSKHTGIVSPAYFVCRPNEAIDARYYHYLLRSSVYLAELTRLSKFMPPSQFDIGWEDLRDLPVPQPPLAEQRAIADYLDAETARIDALIAKKQQLIHLLEERIVALIDETCVGRDITLRRAIERFVDYRGATPDKTSDGVPLLTATHIKSGSIDHSLEPVFLHHETYESWMRRGFPRRGDVLLTMEAPLGEVAQIDSEQVALAQRLMLLKPLRELCEPDYLAYAFRSTVMQERLRSHATGSTALGIKADRLKGLPLPLPGLTQQSEAVGVLRRAEEVKSSSVACLQDQVDLLAERRQALITATVTGEFLVPGAA